MKNFIVYNSEEKILRRGFCTERDFEGQAHGDELIMEGTANDVTQKIVDKQVVDKTVEEIEADNPVLPEIPEGKKLAHITNEQWQAVLDRLADLEKGLIK